MLFARSSTSTTVQAQRNVRYSIGGWMTDRGDLTVKCWEFARCTQGQWKVNQRCSLIPTVQAMFCFTLHWQPPAPSQLHSHSLRHCLPPSAAGLMQHWLGQDEHVQAVYEWSHCSIPRSSTANFSWRSSQLSCPWLPVIQVRWLQHLPCFPLCLSQRT